MPICEFRCRTCGSRFEALLRSAEGEVSCPSCGATVLEKQVTAPAHVSSRSKAEAGHTCCGRDERCARPPCSDGGNCRRA